MPEGASDSQRPSSVATKLTLSDTALRTKRLMVSIEVSSIILQTSFRPLPLADQAGGHVQITSEHGVARSLCQSQLADLLRLQTRYGCQTHVVEFAHCHLVHQNGGVEAFGRF